MSEDKDKYIYIIIGVVPSMSGENKKLQEVYETSGMEKGIENEENAILSSTPMSDEE